MRIFAAAPALAMIMTTGCAAPAAQIDASRPASASHDGWQEQSLYIESFDGTRLAITVHIPTAGGRQANERLPVIVTQDRSNLSPAAAGQMRSYTNRGYVWVSQDRRGTGASFGVQTGFVNQSDARDAKAVIDWAARQDFSSGKTVAMGCSNQGAWQYLVATLKPESLVAIVPGCASPQLFDDAIAINGVPMAELSRQPYAGECARPPSGARPAGFVPPPPRRVDSDTEGRLLSAAQAEQRCGAAMLGQYWLDMPRDGFNAFAGYRPALDDTSMTHWREVKDSGIAILQIGGWYDAAVAGQIEAQRLWGGRLIMGPWVHGNRTPRGAQIANANMDLTAETLRFFDHYAKGVDNGADRPGITYYTANAEQGQEWTTLATWPDHERTHLYLVASGALQASAPVSASDAPATQGAQAVHWFGGRYSPLNRWAEEGSAPVGEGSLLHETAALPSDTQITGTISAHLWISADQPDVDVFAMLLEIAPDGTASYITDGRIRASWRKVHPLPWGGKGRIWHRGFAEDLMPLEPGKPEQLQFDFFPVSHVVKAGHKLRLSVTASIGVAYHAPPLAKGGKARLTLYRDARHPSAISIPVAPQ